MKSGMESGTASSLSSGPPENGDGAMQRASLLMAGVIPTDMQDTLPVSPWEDPAGWLD